MGENEVSIEKDEQVIEIPQKAKSKADIAMHKDIALQQLNNLMCNYLDNPNTMDKTDKLAYWLEDFCRLISFEKDFKPYFFKSYNRGDVIKVNLGYNIGNEEGGLHYCIVVDKHNSKNSGIITVVPLTSDKGKQIHFSEVNLGNEIFINLNNKYQHLKANISKKINELTSLDIDAVQLTELQEATKTLRALTDTEKEINRMKKGSIAMVSQITTISKQKIYDPQTTKDVLSGIRISDASLDLINNKMKQLFVKI